MSASEGGRLLPGVPGRLEGAGWWGAFGQGWRLGRLRRGIGWLGGGWLLIALLVDPFIAARSATHPPRAPLCCLSPADVGLVAEDVRLLTRDGVTLRGWYIPGRNRAAVIVAHGYGGHRALGLPVARFLAEHGYGVLLFDLRAHGESGGEVLPYGGDEAEDIVAAAAYVQARPDVDPQRIGAMGFSLGAQVALLGAARTQAVQAVVADGPGMVTLADLPPPRTLDEWRYLPFDMVFFHFLPHESGVAAPMPLHQAITALAPRPVFLISAGQNPHEVQRVRRFYALAQEPKVLWEVPDAEHLEGHRRAPHEYEQRVLAFFEAALLRSPFSSGD